MKQKFTAGLWQEGDTWIAQCFQVDIASQGDTEKEAFENLIEAVELHFESPVATVFPHIQTFEVEISATA
jgi:predicted RNase H-like HicB family nuclease